MTVKKEQLQKLSKENIFKSMGELIYELLQQEIIHVRLLPGTKLNEAQLAKNLDVSRSPVKYALDCLIAEGLLDKEEHKAPTVAAVDVKDCLQICKARICVEGTAAYLAAKYATTEQLSVIENYMNEYLDQLNSGIDTNIAVESDYNFHTAIINASNNNYIIEMYNTIRSRVQRYRFYMQYLIGNTLLRGELVVRTRGHNATFFALKHGLSDIAQKEISTDIEGMRDMFALKKFTKGQI